ncbi:substrate-binding domain-containing protein [Nocardioides zhouii]|uniref:substrate-binding domain-containing protein n=1 Tax=Nocardioides zhouii TaxID=1168729 RepID=UPI001A91B067|nr:substrate-binding domain-containing protein [Nocardioides zhouii]
MRSRSRRTLRAKIIVVPTVALFLLAAACSSGSSGDSSSGADAVADGSADKPECSDDASIAGPALEPDGIVGQGPNGEAAASPDDIAISAADGEEIKAGNFEVALVFQFAGDWPNGQTRGLTDEFGKYGVKIVSNTEANFKVDKQIANIQNAIQLAPDGIISIPVDDVATAPAYKKVAAAGIKLVFMDNAAQGLEPGKDYQSVISADSQGNGQIAAAKLACYIPEGGTIGIIDFGITFFVTNQRTKGVKDWFAENRPDVTIKEAAFTDPNQAGDVAANFLTANPDVQGVFAVWDGPAAGVIAALRAQGRDIPVTTIDLGDQAATDIATGEYLKGVGAQRPYDQGVAEADAMMLSLIGTDVPDWIGVPSLAVVQNGLRQAYDDAWKKPLPATIEDACAKAEPACG